MSENLNLAAYPSEALNAIADVVRDRVYEGYMYLLSERYGIAASVLDALRSLPVDQRMEAMGMEPCGFLDRNGAFLPMEDEPTPADMILYKGRPMSASPPVTDLP